MKEHYQEEVSLLTSIKTGASESLKLFYESYRREFVQWGQKNFNCSYEEAVDVYQDAIIVLYENIVKEKLTHMESRLKTYLFAVGKNLILRRYDKLKRAENNIEEIKELWGYNAYNDHEEEDVVEIAEHFKQMSDPCKSILYLYYYKNLPMKTIAGTLGYKNDDVVKSQKVRCLKTLKEHLLQNKKL